MNNMLNGNLVEFQDFSFRYPQSEEDIIHNASFHIRKGTINLLYGLSGSGKSTLCYAMTGLIPWSIRGFIKGDVIVIGKNTKDVRPNQFAGEIGYLMQNPDSQFATLNVYDELIFAAENIQVPHDEIEIRLKNIVKLLDLESYLPRAVTQLSSGEKQRVVLGSILMMNPELLILDEPLSFLDFPNRLKLLYYLRKMPSLFPTMGIILAEHRINDVIPFAHNFFEIINGEIHQYSTIPPEVCNQDPKRYSVISNTSFSYRDLISYYGFQENNHEFYPPLQSPLLEFNEVSFQYTQDLGKFHETQVNVLQNISFQVFPGEIVTIVGPNGIGKTTLLYLIAGILEPHQGEITYHKSTQKLSLQKWNPKVRNKISSKNIKTLSYGDYAKSIGLIFQNPESQLLKNTIQKEIEFGPKNFKLYPLLDPKKLSELLRFIFPDTANPENCKDRNPFTLSWGEKRRLNLASLFSYSPSIYLFDEPFTGQDFHTRTALLQIIKTISAESGLVIISSHDDDVLPISDRIFLLDKLGLRIFGKREEDSP